MFPLPQFLVVGSSMEEARSLVVLETPNFCLLLGIIFGWLWKHTLCTNFEECSSQDIWFHRGCYNEIFNSYNDCVLYWCLVVLYNTCMGNDIPIQLDIFSILSCSGTWKTSDKIKNVVQILYYSWSQVTHMDSHEVSHVTILLWVILFFLYCSGVTMQTPFLVEILALSNIPFGATQLLAALQKVALVFFCQNSFCSSKFLYFLVVLLISFGFDYLFFFFHLPMLFLQ